MAEQKKSKTPKIRKVKLEDMTVSEFRAKLEGIELFQDESWHPSKEQWDLIREMINHVQETVEIERISVRQNSQQYQPASTQPNKQQRELPPQREMAQPPMVDHGSVSSLLNIPEPKFNTATGEGMIPTGVELKMF